MTLINRNKGMQQNQQKQDPAPLDLWNGWRHVAPGMLKEIKGGNLNGKSDINPLWRYEALTAAFGPVGIGWNVKEVERWTNECAGEVAAFVKVHLRIKYAGEWSEPIEGTGGSKLCGKGRGDGINDEAWKMATTDAISVACKSLGIAADVYYGQQSHKDSDQKKDGPDYGTKYEGRNYAQISTRNQPGVQSTQRSANGQNRPVSAAPAAAPAPAPAPAATPAAPSRVLVTDAHVSSGKAHNLVTALSKHDYDDLPDWQAGLAELRARYDFTSGTLEKIEQMAVEERNARQQAAIAAAAAAANIPIDDLPA